MPVNQLQYTCPETVRRVYALARSLSRILGEAGLRYWTSGGTTLGILRYVSKVFFQLRVCKKGH
jgi:hypothetical protein